MCFVPALILDRESRQINKLVDCLPANNGTCSHFLNVHLTNRFGNEEEIFADLYLQNTASESWVIDEGIIKSRLRG